MTPSTPTPLHQPGEQLPVARVAELQSTSPEQRWLIEPLWTHEAVGLVGGNPKTMKSWLGLDLAVSVASATPALGAFAVTDPGPALVYLAEDALPLVRERIGGICDHRGLALDSLPLFVITAPSLRLDLSTDQARLAATCAELQPRLLVLDPLVRLHRSDENSSGDISALLGFLRDLQRRFHLAIAVVHHMSKRRRADLGQALRGSGDLHAFGDTNAYLVRQRDGQRVRLTLEHRGAPPSPPVELKLVSRPDGSATHLELVSSGLDASPDPAAPSLANRVLDALRHQQPQSRVALRRRLRVSNARLGVVLTQLQSRGLLERTPDGWRPPPEPDLRQLPLL
jgi:hypothetical protein